MLALRITEDSDLAYVVAAEQDEENRRYVSQQSVDTHKAMMLDENYLHMVVEDKSGRVGYVILRGLKNASGCLELMRVLITDKGKGYGRETLRLAKAYVFEQLNAHRFWLDVVEYNTRACNLYLSEGFVQEGILRECDLFEGQYHSLILMAILEEEYRALT